MRIKTVLLAVVFALCLAGVASAQVVLKDPVGDDFGPGGYSYPTDAVYTPGSFDLVELQVTPKGKNVDFEATVNAKLDDPWSMKVGFAVQMIFIFIDKDHQAGSGFTTGLPGTNVQFAPESAWDACVILSPQTATRVKQEVEVKVAADMAKAVAVPMRTRGAVRTISGSVKLDDLGGGDPATWGYQVVVQSNEGFPDKADLLTRKVNEFEGQHRFGGGTDYDCDPHAMDILAGAAKGEAGEADAQKAMLAYECNPDGTAKKAATLTMIYPAK